MVHSKVRVRKIWMVSREYGDIAGAGGVKDMVRQLSEQLAVWSGRSVHVVLPLYGFLDIESLSFSPVMDPLWPGKTLDLTIQMNEPGKTINERVRFYHARQNRVNLYLVDSQRFRNKLDVYTYTSAEERDAWWQKQGSGHYDYFAMNLLLQKATLELCIALGEQVDLFHCHDGHTGLLPALIHDCPGYRSYFRTTGCLTTVHNAGRGYHQEIEDIPYAQATTGFSDDVIAGCLLESRFDPFLVAGRYGRLNTVSENYARELQETEEDERTGWLGHELKTRGVSLVGITNGIDPNLFQVKDLPDIQADEVFSPDSPDTELVGKRLLKKRLLAELNDSELFSGVTRFGSLGSDESLPLFTCIGRFSEQKGVDILIEGLLQIRKSHPEARSMILGSGSPELELRLRELVTHGELASRCCFLRGFNPQLANRVFAAGDFFVIPSRYEPCGLTDFIAQLFGNIPVVHHVGGLVKVVDGKTGIAYRGDVYQLVEALERALTLYSDLEEKRQIQRQAIQHIRSKYTWKTVMKQYLELYTKARSDRFIMEE